MVAITFALAIVPAFVACATASESTTKFDSSAYKMREVGARNTVDWRIWLEKDGQPASFWHDIPLYPDPKNTSVINMYVEIPRWTNGKVETSRDESLNPIFHDDKKGKPRFVASVWPHRSYPFNYGSLPQTWESPTGNHTFTKFPGDNDPMDVFDISEIEPGYVGQIKQVKVLGGLPMIDENTTDWKAIVVDINDPLAQFVDTVTDLDKYRPGMRQSFHDWFRYYKVVKGDGLNTIVQSDYVNSTFMATTIGDSHVFWQGLIRGEPAVEKDDISIVQTTDSSVKKSYISGKDAQKKYKVPKKSKIEVAAEIPAKYLNWYYLDEDFEVITVPGQVIDID